MTSESAAARLVKRPHSLHSLTRRHRLLARISHPSVDLSLCFITRDTVPLLNSAYELFTTALDLIKVVGCQLTPFLANATLELGPLAFQRVFVHHDLRPDSKHATCRITT